MKSLYTIITCSIFVLVSISSACKKNKDSQLLPPGPPQLPQQSLTINAGQDRSIGSPKDSVILVGTAISIGGSVVSYQWMKIHGPTQGVIMSPNAASTAVTGLVVGNYEFEFTVTDSNGKIAVDRVQVLVYIPGGDPCNGCWDY